MNRFRRQRAIENLTELGNLHGMSFRDIATKANIASSTLSKLQSGRRPSERILRQLCSIWSENENMELLIEHLRDEIERSGYSPVDIDILPSGQPPVSEVELDTSLKNLRELAFKSPEVKQMLLDLDTITQAVDVKRLKNTSQAKKMNPARVQ